eukprot:3273415-Pyramimonas_sp.AAC.2
MGWITQGSTCPVERCAPQLFGGNAGVTPIGLVHVNPCEKRKLQAVPFYGWPVDSELVALRRGRTTSSFSTRRLLRRK